MALDEVPVPPESARPVALDMRGITKSYGALLACDAIDLAVSAGEIHGLLGENGAGKSTLMKVLLGLVTRDAGTISLDGKRIEIADPQAAAALGLGMVHQHFSLIEPLRVWENVVLGDSGKVDRRAACAEVEQTAARYGLPIDPLQRVEQLSAGERQRVELIKCLRRNPSILILDEPTSVLTQAESLELFEVLRRVVQEENRAVVLISHKLTEITSATDRVTVLRRGRVAFHSLTAETTAHELARQMVGRDVSLRAESAALGVLPVEHSSDFVAYGEKKVVSENASSALRLRDLVVRIGGVSLIDHLSLDVRAGEIVGLYGVEGNGQSTLGEVLSGLVLPNGGSVEIDGKAVDVGKPRALQRAGLGIVPEDRHQSGVVLDMSVAENLLLKSIDSVTNGGLINKAAMYAHAQRLATEYNIITSSLDAPLRSLSGGNQQRVVLARELSESPSVLVAAQPTHGLDVGAIEDMYLRLRQAASSGVAILLISTELEEVMALCSRIAVISSGRITGVLTSGEATAERLGLLVGGIAA